MTAGYYTPYTICIVGFGNLATHNSRDAFRPFYNSELVVVLVDRRRRRPFGNDDDEDPLLPDKVLQTLSGHVVEAILEFFLCHDPMSPL